ncbi:xanthine dehydrogenase family protein subunit M [Notoacmeibacter sp. MSK16QG-6]|uniref:FAD binding domain-containing protein n=1 Tax=Notoacmeibacter sp. MSK16QG-6 TaxID=2957982 RepID=UPI0020A04E8E|nr:xanthine dehydrogenase family protein subunit M [Notoacmeibacter sp. MSK16QG-6]MCP1198688.1 xanthine dehydrogenase family protein subunit M [Notoacmeibacter sp. MSK16QG-6]
MKPFQFIRPDSADTALDAISAENAKFMGGGTNLVDLMKLQVETPDSVVDIHRIDMGGFSETEESGLRIGADVTNTALANHPKVRKDYRVLSEALLSGATAQLRNRATTGGNFLQRTRCYYFMDTTRPCNKREPGSGCAALDGPSRIHAILGASDHCIATHPSDMAVAMAALDAQLHTRKPGGENRTIAATELHRLPGDTPNIETVLDSDELIESVTLPQPIGGTHIYRKVRDRSSYAFALVSAALVLKIHDGKIETVRLALGGVAHKPWRAAKAEKCLAGAEANDENFRAAAEAELADANSKGDQTFKIELTKRTIVAALSEAADRENAA